MLLNVRGVLCYDDDTALVEQHDPTLLYGTAPAPGDLVVLINLAASGDPDARNRLAEALYPHLRRIADQRLRDDTPGRSVHATEVFQEAFLKLIDQFAGRHWESRHHILALASQVMRHVLVDRARRKKGEIHGAESGVSEIDEFFPVNGRRAEEILFLDEALSHLGHLDPRLARIVEMKVFGGCESSQIAGALRLPETVVEQEWAFARAWLIREIRKGEGHDGATTGR